MPILQYNVETFVAFLKDAKDLLIEHWNEIAEDKESVLLHPDFDRYIALEQAGNLLVVTIRDSGMLVGYCIMMLGEHLHYTDLECANNDVIYLAPKYRRGRAGLELIKFLEKQLPGYMATWHVKIKHPQLGKILEYLGYEAFEIVYKKRIESGV